MKKAPIFAALIIWVTSVWAPLCLADETRVGGSVGFDVWYSHWETENQWSKEGVDLDYEINPALVYGYSASINYFRKKTFIRGLMLDLLTQFISHRLSR